MADAQESAKRATAWMVAKGQYMQPHCTAVSGTLRYRRTLARNIFACNDGMGGYFDKNGHLLRWATNLETVCRYPKYNRLKLDSATIEMIELEFELMLLLCNNMYNSVEELHAISDQYEEYWPDWGRYEFSHTVHIVRLGKNYIGAYDEYNAEQPCPVQYCTGCGNFSEHEIMPTTTVVSDGRVVGFLNIASPACRRVVLI